MVLIHPRTSVDRSSDNRLIFYDLRLIAIMNGAMGLFSYGDYILGIQEILGLIHAIYSPAPAP